MTLQLTKFDVNNPIFPYVSVRSPSSSLLGIPDHNIYKDYSHKPMGTYVIFTDDPSCGALLSKITACVFSS